MCITEVDDFVKVQRLCSKSVSSSNVISMLTLGLTPAVLCCYPCLIIPLESAMTQQHPSSAVPFDMLNMKQLCDIVHDDYEGSSDCDMLIAIIKKELIDGFALAESSDKDLLDLGITSYGHRKRLLMLAKQTSVVIPTRQPEDPMSRGGDAHGRSPFYSDGEVGMHDNVSCFAA